MCDPSGETWARRWLAVSSPRVVGPNGNAVDCGAGRGRLLAVLGNMNKRPKLGAAWKALDDHLWVIHLTGLSPSDGLGLSLYVGRKSESFA